MSYPDLGCFAECLTCELCGDLPREFDPFSLPSDFLDDGVPNWADPNWGPPPDDDGGLFDFDLPEPIGYPTFDPMGVEIRGEF